MSFLPHIRFHIEGNFGSNRDIDLWATITERHIRWSVEMDQNIKFEDFKGNKHNVTVSVPIFNQFMNFGDFLYSGSEDCPYVSKMRQRILDSRVMDILPLIFKSPNSDTGILLWRIFTDLYYPDCVEDEYNSWVKEYIPEFHESNLKSASYRNLVKMKSALKSME